MFISCSFYYIKKEDKLWKTLYVTLQFWSKFHKKKNKVLKCSKRKRILPSGIIADTVLFPFYIFNIL